MWALAEQHLNLKRDILSGGATIVGIRVVTTILTLALNVLLTRSLGVDDSGRYYLALAIVTFLANICTLGFGNYLVKQVAQYMAKRQFAQVVGLAAAATLICLTASALVVTLAFFFSDKFSSLFLDDGSVSLVITASLLIIPLSALTTIFCSLLKGAKRQVHSALIAGLLHPLLFLIFILFSLRNLEIISVITSYSLASFFVCMVAALRLFFISNLRAYPKFQEKHIFRSVFPFWTLMVMTLFSEFFGRFILGVYSGPADVAIFSVSSRIATSITLLLTALNMMAAPRIAELYANGDLEGIRVIIRLVMRALVVVVIPILVGIIVYRSQLLRFFGDAFVDGSSVLLVLALAQGINTLFGPVGYLLMMTNRAKIYNLCIGSGVLSCILSGFLFVPKFGALGAAFMIFVAIAVNNLSAYLVVRRTLKINTLRL